MKSLRFHRCIVIAMLLTASSFLFAGEADYRLTPIQPADGATVSASQFPDVAPAKRHPLITVVSSLAIVLGGFAVVTAVFRKLEKPRAKPSDLMETLGAVQVTPKVKLHLVRLGSRLLVLHLGANSVERVAEISDPAEVESLLNGSTGESSSADVPQVDQMLRAVGATGANL